MASSPVAGGDSTNETAHDPNALVGPAGFGTQSFIQPTGTLPYTIDFQNDGSAAAQDVTVTEQLDPNLDWSTFQLGSFGFGPVKFTIPAGLTEYQTTVAYQNTDGSSLNVLVALNFNVQTGLLTVTFTSLDPATGETPTGVIDGFLPPDNSSGVGEGYVQYTVQPKANLATGATINQQAAVVFDINAPLNTKTVTNTIDSGPPTSSVAALPVSSAPTFTVSWSGQDDTGGSGIASFDVFVSDNGGPFTAFQTATTQTSATFSGTAGHTYGFYSVASDNVGNRQTTPSAAQASTVVVGPSGTITTTTPSFAWALVTGTKVDSYTIWLTDETTGNVQTFPNQAGPTFTLTNPLALGHNYTWWVGAVEGQHTIWNKGLTFTIAPTASGPSGAVATVTPTFSWIGVAGVTSYTIWLTDQTSGVTQTFANQPGPTFNLAAPLAVGHNYIWWAGAVQGQSTTWSSGLSFTIPLTATGPSGTSASTLPTFSWSNVAGVTSYTVWLTDQTSGVTQTFPNQAGPTFTPTSALTLGHNYIWWVGAVQGTSTSWSNGLTFTIAPAASGPSGVLSTVMPTFSWMSVTGVTSYTVWLTDQTTGVTQTFPNQAGPTFTPTSALKMGDNYIWWVGAVQGRTTTWSNGLTFTIAPTAIGPSGAISTLTPAFSWNTVTGVTSYSIWLTDQTTGVTQVIPNLPGPTYQLTSSLAVGHSYIWWIGAVQGQSTTWSSGVTFTIPLTASGPSGTIASAVPTFVWGPVSGVTSYTIWLTDVTTNVTQLFPNLPGPSAAPTEALTLGDNYIWWVGAVQGQNTTWDSALTFIILP